MTTLALAPAPAAIPLGTAGFAGEDGGRSTLDAVVSSAWEGLLARTTVRCPVCTGELTWLPAADGGVRGGRCRDCASELS
jgi:hypothetical protein